MITTRRHRPHWKMAPPGIILFLLLFCWELLSNLPALLALRFKYRRRQRIRSGEPVVACISDNLDEVNGIALASRIMVRKLRELGKTAFLFGVAYHARPPRREGPEGCIILAPGRFSLEQAGYPESETTLIRLAHFVRFLRAHPVDIIEFETPAPTSVICLIGAKLVGIKTLSHYRTDILTYSRLLVKNRFGVWFINAWTKMITRVAGPVIVPSRAYRGKVAEMGVPFARIFKLPRGVDFENFHPDKARNGSWQAFGLPSTGTTLLYVGRVSLEKNLALLAETFPLLLKQRPDLSLVVVGEGPYRAELQKRLEGTGRAYFTGVVHGEQLAGLFASADIFVFPSLTDTFGNSVVEALASGVPCITSDQGGPPEIIVDGECGLVFDHEDHGDLGKKILMLAEDPVRLKAFKAKARERAMEFTYDHSAQSFWEFYRRYHHNQIE